VTASVKPCRRLAPIACVDRGAFVDGYAEALCSGIPSRIGTRELAQVGAVLGWEGRQLRLRSLPGEQGPGNALLLTLVYEAQTDVFAAFGTRGITAEAVANQALAEAQAFIASGAAVGEHLADQLMLPLALAGGGRFTLSTVSGHSATNAAVIERFLPVSIRFEHGGPCALCTIMPATAR
jgi:RNA 3'-terminal phosphate cyclase (ATP)